MLISAGNIITASVKLYRDNARLFLKYMGLLFIPTAIIGILGFYSYQSDLMGIIYFIVTLAAVIVTVWISIAFIINLADIYQAKKRMEMKTELQKASPMILPVIWVSILTGLAILVGSILLIIPGIIFWVWFAFSHYIVILENKRGTEALKASKKMVEGRWFGIFWRLFAPGFVFVLLMVILQAVVTLPFGDLRLTEFGLIVMALLSSAASLLVTPLSTAALTILYLEAKKNPAAKPMNKPEPKQEAKV